MTYNFEIKRIKQSRVDTVDFSNIPFGRVFSDHMFMADYIDGEWRNLTIQPYQKLQMSPANMALHYGQSIFEGMKVMADAEGEPLFFRLDKHIERLNISAHRMGIPPLPAALFEQAIKELIVLDKKWIPNVPNSALYVRPFMFAADEYIGVRPSDTYKFIIFTCPVGVYYAKPVKILTSEKYVRSFDGGTGYAKAAGNYAATLRPAMEAKQQGYDQVMWLDGVKHEFIQECGTMNLFFVIGDTVITPPLDGNILAGITRDSIIQILQYEGYTVEERFISINEVASAYQRGQLKEAFGTGTAVVVSHISEIKHQDVQMILPPVSEQTVALLAKQILSDIRKGIRDPFGWNERALAPVVV